MGLNVGCDCSCEGACESVYVCECVWCVYVCVCMSVVYISVCTRVSRCVWFAEPVIYNTATTVDKCVVNDVPGSFLSCPRSLWWLPATVTFSGKPRPALTMYIKRQGDKPGFPGLISLK